MAIFHRTYSSEQMAELGRRGGRSKSERKRVAAQTNAAKAREAKKRQEQEELGGIDGGRTN